MRETIRIRLLISHSADLNENTLNMILSMTGFGKADATYGEKRIHVVVKTLNSKTLDINSRIAPQYRDGELELRNMISARVASICALSFARSAW